MPRKRRGAGEGSIYRRKDGRWAASISLGGRRRKTFYGKTRQEVQEAMKQALYEQQRGTLVTGRQTKLADFLNQWLEEIKRPGPLKPLSYVVYRDILDLHLIPALGHLAIGRLTPQHVQRLYTEKSAEGLSPSSIHRIHAVLHGALKLAVEWNLVARNVCDVVKPPQPGKKEYRVLSKDEAKQLLATAAGHWLEPVLILAITTGMRLGEILALRWQDIDFEQKLLVVRHTVAYVKDIGMQEGTPKTSKSHAAIALPGITLSALSQHRATHPAVPSALVFCRPSGAYYTQSIVRWDFERLLVQAGLPHIRFHDLRHSAATFLLGMGVPMKIVQDILRHSNISMTADTYSHVSAAMQAEAMGKWDVFFEEG